MGGPVGVGACLQAHLGKQEGSFLVPHNFIALMRTTAIKSPVPQGKHENVCHP